ncbi:hypothetical protein GCM10022405_07740 [Gibbsiella dentisursi]|uniref:Uncharacterized protein n=1 Tax=Gibbsiella dentisursi TaxID=796890 RepID=A0ABP7KPK8_9GAMM
MTIRRQFIDDSHNGLAIFLHMYSYVKMLKIEAKPCKNKMNLINSLKGVSGALLSLSAAAGSLRHMQAHRAAFAGWLKT